MMLVSPSTHPTDHISVCTRVHDLSTSLSCRVSILHTSQPPQNILLILRCLLHPPYGGNLSFPQMKMEAKMTQMTMKISYSHLLHQLLIDFGVVGQRRQLQCRQTTASSSNTSRNAPPRQLTHAGCFREVAWRLEEETRGFHTTLQPNRYGYAISDPRVTRAEP